MNPVLDNTVVIILVVVSALIVGYSFSPLKTKRWILSKLSRYVGIRVVTWLLPKNCGCDDCPTTKIHSQLRTKVGQE